MNADIKQKGKERIANLNRIYGGKGMTLTGGLKRKRTMDNMDI